MIKGKKHRQSGKMRKQRSTFQIQEQNKYSEKELNKMEMSNLSGKEFKEIAIKMLTELGRKVDELSEDLGNKEIEN